MADITWDAKDKNIKDGVHNRFRDIDANQVKTAVNSKLDKSDAVIAGAKIVTDCGIWNGATGTFPTGLGSAAPGSAATGEVLGGQFWELYLADPDGLLVIGGKSMPNGAIMRARIDGAGNDPADWKVTLG